jgi:hypothetical protein
VERALQEQARQDMRALQEQARQGMRAGKQVISYPGEASTAQPLQDLFDNWDAEKIASSVAEAALGRQASGSWAWLSSITAQSLADRSLVTRDSERQRTLHFRSNRSLNRLREQISTQPRWQRRIGPARSSSKILKVGPLNS